MVFDLAELSLFPATTAQVQASRKLNHDHWGRGLNLEEYLKRADLLDIHEHATDGNLMTWVLAPRDNPQTLEFLSACETFRRVALIQEPSSHKLEETFAYGIAAVFCHPQHRNKGYARHMMRLLHYVLASPGSLPPFPSSWGVSPVPPSGAGNARFSVLWSDVGPAFYENCGPTLKHVGWKVKDPISTIWTTVLLPRYIGETRWLSELDCIELWQQDTQYIRDRLTDSPQCSSTRCTFLSDCGLAAYQLRRTKFFLPGLHDVPLPKKWGAIILGTSQPTYATWITDIRPLPVALVITRISATPETFPDLLSVIMEAATENEAATVEVWNLEQSLLEAAHRSGGRTAKRVEHIPALAWYGSEDVDNVEWLFNEKRVILLSQFKPALRLPPRFCWC